MQQVVKAVDEQGHGVRTNKAQKSTYSDPVPCVYVL